MSSLQHVALVQSHQRLTPFHPYYLTDLVELCGLAAFIREEVSQVDIPVSPSDRDPLASFERYIRRNRPGLVGISAFTCGAKSASEYAAIAKNSGAFVVVGGFHATARPEEVLGWPGVDVVVRGEGEHALRSLVRAGAPDGIPGVSYRSNGGFIHNPVPPTIDDLDSLPLPARDLRPARFGLSGLNYHTDTIYASRGCRGRCSFCANDLIGRNWRARSNELVLEELLTITPPRKGPWKYVKFWDSNFLADSDRIEELCGMILAERLERWFRFIVETRVEDIIRAAPILKTMRKAGFVRMGCGVESPNEATHRGLRKGINLDYVGQAAQLVADSNMQFTKFLIVGHANESREDILAYPDYALSHGTRLQKTTVFVMTPYPGTQLAAEYVNSNRVASFDWDLYNNLGAVVEQGGMSSLELQGLLFGVTGGIAMGVRLRKGKTLLQAAARLFEPLFVAVTMARLGERYTRKEVVSEIVNMLGRLPVPNSCRRPTFAKRRFGDWFALRFHGFTRPSAVLGIVEEDGTDGIAAHLSEEALRRRGIVLPEIHVSIPLVVELMERIDQHRVAHDASTLRCRPMAFRLRWLPSLVRQSALVASSLVRLLLFHVRTSIAGTT